MLQKKLNSYISRFSGGPTQNSEEWQVERRKYIGGSEMGTVLGKDTFSNVLNLITKKLPYEITKFTDTIPKFACKWGHLFEPVIKEIINMKLKTKIVGDNIWIRDPTVHPHITNSPDGFGIVNIKKTSDGKIQITNASGCEPKIVLFEFKCPISRPPKDDKIPDHYLPQVQNGLNISSEIVNTAIFVDAKFVKCAVEDFKQDAYHFDKKFHNYNPPKKTVDSKGYFLINKLSSKLIEYITTNHPEVMYTDPITNKTIIDFGKCNYFCFVETLIDDSLNTKCIIVSKTSGKIDFSEFKSNVIGILPWKLVKLVLVPVVSDNEKYKSLMYPKIDNIFNDIELIKNNPDLFEVYIQNAYNYIKYKNIDPENVFKSIDMNTKKINIGFDDELIRDFLHKRIFSE